MPSRPRSSARVARGRLTAGPTGRAAGHAAAAPAASFEPGSNGATTAPQRATMRRMAAFIRDSASEPGQPLQNLVSNTSVTRTVGMPDRWAADSEAKSSSETTTSGRCSAISRRASRAHLL